MFSMLQSPTQPQKTSINVNAAAREELEAAYSQVWDAEQLRRDSAVAERMIV